MLWAEYLGKNTNVFQCAGNLPQLRCIVQRDDLSKRAKRSLPHLFNFAYGANLGVLVLERLLPGFEDGTEEGNFVFSVDKYYSRKMAEIVSPADCIAFGDRPGWHTRKGLHNSLLWIYPEVALHGIAPFTSSGHPDYTFMISRRHVGRANMAFLDGHVEHGSLRGLDVAYFCGLGSLASSQSRS